MAVVTWITRNVGLSIAKDFEDNTDAEVLVWSRNMRGGLEPAGEKSRKVVGADLGLISISEPKEQLGELVEYRLCITLHVKKTCFHFGLYTWHKINDKLKIIREVGLNGSTRNRRNPIDTLTSWYNFL